MSAVRLAAFGAFAKPGPVGPEGPAGPAGTDGATGPLADVLVLGNTTGPTDIRLTAGARVIGADGGGAAALVGGPGVDGGAALLAGADSIGPDGNGGNVTVRGGAGMGAGIAGLVLIESARTVAINADIDIQFTAGTGILSLMAAEVASSAGVQMRVATVTSITDFATTSLDQVAGTAATRTADTIFDAAMVNSTRNAVSGSITDDARTALTRTVSAGSISDTASVNASRTATTGSISDNAGTTLGQTAVGAVTRASSGASVADTANTTIIQTAGTNAARTATAGTITDTAGTTLTQTAGTNAARTATAETITDTASGVTTRISAGDRVLTTSTPATDYHERKTYRSASQVIAGSATGTIATIAALTANSRQVSVKVSLFAYNPANAAHVLSWRYDVTFYRSGGVVTALTAHQNDTQRTGAASTLGQAMVLSLSISGDNILIRALNSSAGSLTGTYTANVETQSGGV